MSPHPATGGTDSAWLFAQPGLARSVKATGGQLSRHQDDLLSPNARNQTRSRPPEGQVSRLVVRAVGWPSSGE